MPRILELNTQVLCFVSNFYYDQTFRLAIPPTIFLIVFIFLEQLLAHSNFVHKYRDFPYASYSYTCIACSIINNPTTTSYHSIWSQGLT